MPTQTDKILEKVINTGSAQPCILLVAQQILNLNTTADQQIRLRGGTKFIITDIVLTNVSSQPTNADDAQWFDGENRTGFSYANTTGYSPQLSNLISSSWYMNTQPNGGGAAGINLNIAAAQNGSQSATSPLYFSLGAAEGAPLTCDMYIYGTILQ